MLFSVVVPVNDEEKFRKNVLASPGLAEVEAPVFPVRGAWSAADAFYSGEDETEYPWILFCHQDVFFASGFGRLIETALLTIPDSEAFSTVIGLIGLDAGSTSGDFRLVGQVTDTRDNGNGPTELRGPETDSAISIDELAVLLHRDSKFEIDARLGWHLWATDLCLQADDSRTSRAGGKARVFRMADRSGASLVLHNTTSPRTLPTEFDASAKVLLKKHPGRATIASLCAVLTQELIA